MEHTYNKGSEWRKWDLHIHTPASIDQKYGADKWDEFITSLESLPSEVKVIGITDYYFIDGFEKVMEYKSQGRLNNLDKIFPILEFRIDTFGSSSENTLHKINLHILFDINDSKFKDEVKLIKDEFISQIHLTCLDKHKTTVLSKENLIKEGENDLRRGFEGLIPSTKEVFSIINSSKWKNKTFLFLGYKEWSNLDKNHQLKPFKIDLYEKVSAFFTANASTLNKSKGWLSEYGEKTLLHSLDIHDFESLSSSNYQCNTWIKADPTFEGLKQVLYEPKHRISISEQKPRDPMRKINFIKFNFPANTYIKRSDSDEKQAFCLQNLKFEIPFSSYFTCLVGGRGTGKSTIINTLGKRLNEKTDFFTKNNLLINDKPYNIAIDNDNYIAIDGTNEIEFVSQGRVEQLAEANELTKLIFNERIKDIDADFHLLDERIKNIIDLIDKNVKKLFLIQEKNRDIQTKKKEKNNIENIIASVNDDKYKSITERILVIKTELGQIENSNSRYQKLLDSIKNILLQTPINENKNEIEERINFIREAILKIEEINLDGDSILVNNVDFKQIVDRQTELNKYFEIENNNLSIFFKEKGTSEEAIKDSQNANENLSRITANIKSFSEEVNTLVEQYNEEKITIDTFQKIYNDYYKLIEKNINIINKKLEVSNENILKISYRFDFNTDKFSNSLFEEFYDTFKQYQKSGVQAIKVKEVLFYLKPDIELLNSDYDSFIRRFNTEIDKNGTNRNNLYVKLLLEIFEEKINFTIYKLLISKHLFNLPAYILINGFYGMRELINCSFGQRCTAVVVTLLMSGVKPLIIDEPEAHLDNRLIADYLVELIKIKKLDRQIIFATHNSNFVINGDSELIHILDIPNDDIFTNIVSTSIENIEHRDKLLKLEGGREAFIIRENKYGIQH